MFKFFVTKYGQANTKMNQVETQVWHFLRNLINESIFMFATKSTYQSNLCSTCQLKLSAMKSTRFSRIKANSNCISVLISSVKNMLNTMTEPNKTKGKTLGHIIPTETSNRMMLNFPLFRKNVKTNVF